MHTLNTCASPAEYASYGAQLNASASLNTMGAWVQLDGGTGTPIAGECLMVQVYQNSVAANYLFDIGIDDGAGNVQLLVQNLQLNSPLRRTSNNSSDEVAMPLHVPKGSILVARMQCSVAETTCYLKYRITQNLGGAPGYARCVPLTASANSRGVQADPGSTANTEVITELVASTALAVKGLMVTIGSNDDTSIISTSYWYAALMNGAAGQEAVFPFEFVVYKDTLTDSTRPMVLPFIPMYLAAGSRLSVRLSCNVTNASDRRLEFSLYGFC